MSKLTPQEAREKAIALVGDAIKAGVLSPLPAEQLTKYPGPNGERLGHYIGSAIETLAKRLQDL